MLPNENEDASDETAPGLACSQQAHFDREASFRVIHALHSHLLADCCATNDLNSWSAAAPELAGIENIDLIAAGTAAAGAGAAPGLAFSQQTHFDLSASFRVIQSEHSHLADCLETRALNPASAAGADLLALAGTDPNEKLLLGASLAAVDFAPGLGVSQATHLVFSGSFRTIHASHSHLLDPVSLKAFPNPALAGAVTGFASASRQLPDFSSGTVGPFSASKQLPLFSGTDAFVGEIFTGAAATTVLGLAVSGLNLNPPSLLGVAGEAPLLTDPIGSGLLNLKLFCTLALTEDTALAGRASFAGAENLYTLLLVGKLGEVVVQLRLVSLQLLSLVLVVVWVSFTLVALLSGAVLFAPAAPVAFHPEDNVPRFPLLLLLLPVATAGNLMSNLGTDFNPASCTSGRFTCGIGVLLLRSKWDSSRTRCNLLRILLVCLTLLLLSSASVGSVYSVGSFSIVLPLDSVASRRTDSVLVWRRFMWSSWDIEGICSSAVGGLFIEEEVLFPVALTGRLYGVRGLDIRMLRLMLRSSSLNRLRA